MTTRRYRLSQSHPTDVGRYRKRMLVTADIGPVAAEAFKVVKARQHILYLSAE